MSNILANNINPRSGNKITIGNVNTTVAIAGTATYEDVTSIDSVGIITARSGVNVTGGSVGIGTDNPSSTFVVRGDDLTKAIRFQTNTSTQSSMLFQNSTTGFSSNDGLYFGIDQEEDGYLWHFESENLIFGTSNTERLRIKSDGNVGIGTVNPFAKLHVNKTSPTTVPAAGSNSHPVVIGDVGFGAAIGALHNGKSYIQGTRWDGTAANYSLLFNPNGGSVGIGTDNPVVKLDIVDSGSPNIALRGSSYPSIRYSALDGTTDAEIYYGISGNDLVLNNVNAGPTILKTNNVERLRITSDGNFGFGDNGPSNFTGYTNLSIHGSTGGVITFGDDGTDEWEIYGGDGILKIYDRTNTAERLRITSGGLVGVNVTPTQQKLTIDVDSSGTSQGSFDGINICNTNNTTNNGAAIAFGQAVSGNSYARIGVINTDRSGGSEDQAIFFGTLGGGSYGERVRITSNVGPWAEGNKGSTPGTLHLRPGTTDHMGGAITFGASDTGSGDSAMAGIYTRSDGTYGSKMYLATTESYATGPQNFLEADHYGRIRTPRQPFIYGRPTNTTGSGIFNALGSTLTRGGLAFTSDRITVATEGVYIITFNTICDSSTGRLDARIRINGNTIVNTLSEANGNGFHYRSASICYYLNANDYIQVDNEDWYDASSSNTDWKTMSVALLG